ncbi:MAG: response regulator [Promethearchaeota archaeon]
MNSGGGSKIASVFIVEDDQSLRLLFRKVLGMSGFDVIGEAKNGEEAVSLYSSFPQKPDIILMDHRMPIKNGIEATKQILNINKKSKIIFTSADNSIKQEALSIGAKSFLDKPFSITDLIDIIKKISINLE